MGRRRFGMTSSETPKSGVFLTQLKFVRDGKCKFGSVRSIFFLWLKSVLS